MEFFENKTVQDFLKKFDGDFIRTVPDNILVYSYDDELYIVDEKDVEKIAKQSIEKKENLFLYLEKQTEPEGALI